MILETLATFVTKVMAWTGYVSKVTGFKKPLDSKTERELIEKMQEGDDSAKKTLIEHNLRLITHVLKKYTTAGESDDLIGVGTIGLIKAINSYKLDKGVQLSTYAATCIENEILMMIRSSKKHANVISLDEKLGIDKDGNDITLSELLGDEKDALSNEVENNVIKEQLIKFLKENLPTREYKILVMRFGLDGKAPLTQIEVAEEMKISRSYISRLENKALLSLRKKKIPLDMFY